MVLQRVCVPCSSGTIFRLEGLGPGDAGELFQETSLSPVPPLTPF